MLIGAGEMAELSAKHLVNAGAPRVDREPNGICRTTTANQIGDAETVPFERLEESLHEADLVICSTGAPDYVLTEAHMRKVTRRRRKRPTCLIDISVPRNIDPAGQGAERISV